MLSNIRRLLITGALIAAATLATSAIAAAQGWTRTFTVINESNYRIDHLNVSPNTSGFWGPDTLGQYVLQPGYRYNVSVFPGWYDVRLIDRDGDECIVRNVDFRNGDTWTITDSVLLYCEGF